MANWLVETRTLSERTDLYAIFTHLSIPEIYEDGSILVNCPQPSDEDAIVEYCEDNDLECKLS